MRIYRALFKCVFVPMDAERAHRIGYRGIQLFRAAKLSGLARKFFSPHPDLATEVMGLRFPSPFGLAAGFDKESGAVNALTDIGFGHVEVGTVTGQKQAGNPRPRLFRLVDDRAVINRMGFNNDGAATVAPRLAAARAALQNDYDGKSIRPLIGVNIGKTKVVELEHAIDDYRISTRILAPQADYLAVNVSSPNTPGLRSLQAVHSLKPLLEAVREEADRAVSGRRVPLLVKIAPDAADEDIVDIARLALELKLDGIIATNTTVARDDLNLRVDRHRLDRIGAGGLSGQPLRSRSLEVTQLIKDTVGDRLAIISVGGVSCARDVQQRLDAGADLVQGYTAFIYEGPLWAYRVNRELLRIKRSGSRP